MNRSDYYRPTENWEGPVKPNPEREKLLPGGPITNLKLKKLSPLENPFSLCILPQLYGLFMEVVEGCVCSCLGVQRECGCQTQLCGVGSLLPSLCGF